MQNKFILTDGQKSMNLWDVDDPSGWTFFSGGPKSDSDKLYSLVSAAFRAYNLKANTVGNMPFTLNKKGGAEYDNSATWENKVGFLPNPSELFRLNTLSYIATNTIYNLRTSDALGYKVKGLRHAVATFFVPVVNSVTGDVDYIERRVNGGTERYKMEDKKLIRLWRLDHTTELLPSPNTEARAIMNAAGEVYYADVWIKHFYERGGIAPTIIAMKGAVSPDKKEQEEKSWGNWFRQVGKFSWRPGRVVNADTLDVKQLGSSVTDLKNNETYQRAITNIAMGTGMPLSLLMANSANYATAKEEKATWYENDIIPFCNWMAYEYNRQVFEPIGLFLQFHPETLDPQQEDETERAQAVNTFADYLAKCPTYEVFEGICDTFGYELSDSLKKAAKAYYADKEARAAEVQAQMQQAGVVVGEDGKPVAQEQGKQPAEAEADEEDEDKKPKPFGKGWPQTPITQEMYDDATVMQRPAKWTPSLDQLRELQRWQELAFRKLKRAEAVTFEWRNDTLPEDVFARVRDGLTAATDEDSIKAAFDVAALETVTTTPAPVYVEDPNIKTLADSINRMAEAMMSKQLQVST